MFKSKYLRTIIFVLIGVFILISARYISFDRLRLWFREMGKGGKEGKIDLDFATSSRSVCQIGGTVYFKAADLSLRKTADAVFRYRNIDSIARVIFWSFSPEDDIKGAPNMFVQLEIPDGEVFPVSFSFEKEPKYKEYVVKAIITYADWINGDLESGKRDCEGEIKIIIDENWQ